MRARPFGDGRVVRRRAQRLLLLALAFPAAASAQGGASDAGAEGAAAWHGRVSGTQFFLPDQPDYLQLVGAADRGPLHLESRFNYEDRRTLSLFAGRAFSFGDALQLTVVPMLGGVVGRTDGVAPGLELTVAWGRLEYYLETEVVFDLGNSAASYFYSWAQLDAQALEWLRVSVALQRTRVIKAPREISVGPGVGVHVWRADVTVYWFSPGADGQYVSAGVSVEL